MSNKEHIEKIIENTFRIIREVYQYQKENVKENKEAILSKPESRIIFPMKRNETTRVSEQELKQIFIEQLNNEINNVMEPWNVYYSVETPTKCTHRFQQTEGSKKSARFDLTIHDENFKRIALIEFKSNNQGNHEKDILKLKDEVAISKNENITDKNEEELLRYFIEMVRNADKGTIDSLRQKMKDETGEIIFKCCSLEEESLKYGDITSKIFPNGIEEFW